MIRRASTLFAAALLGALMFPPRAGVAAPHVVGARRTPNSRIAPRPFPAPAVLSDGGVLVPPTLRECVTDPEDRDFADIDATDETPPPPAPAPLTGANLRLNDTSLDPSNVVNAETTIAAWGQYLVAGWNDSYNFEGAPGNVGWGWSTDGGLTWHDEGVLPTAGPIARHQGDPVVVSDAAGNFYFADLFTRDGAESDVAVCHGRFTSTGFAWSDPVVVAVAPTDLLDKEWLAVDPEGQAVHCTYTHYLVEGGDRLEYTRSTDGGVSWSEPVSLTNSVAEGTTGARVLTAPGGVVEIVYLAYDRLTRSNWMRAFRSTDFGATWGPQITLPAGPDGVLMAYGAGPPGFNRSYGVDFPGLAIDRSGGPHNGRLYAVWAETVNFYRDVLGLNGTYPEVEPNNTYATAKPITIGDRVSGRLANGSDEDWYSFTGTAGQTAILYLTPNPDAPAYIRVYSGGGGTANQAMISFVGYGVGLCVYTLPATGTYAFRIAGAARYAGNYAVQTGWHTPRPGDDVARDTRDIVLSWSDDGIQWSPRAIVNDDPAGFDEAFPEVAVDPNGNVLVEWSGHRNDPLGIASDIFLARSTDGGASFTPVGQVNDGGSTNWNLVAVNISPNMGDYNALLATDCHVFADFGDGRQGTPDAWLATLDGCATPARLAFVSAAVRPGRVELTWYDAGGATARADVQRREGDAAWETIGAVSADGTGRLVFRDVAARAGARYAYRLALEGGQVTAAASVTVPATSGLALVRVADTGAGGVDVGFALGANGAASLSLVDVCGRTVFVTRVGESGALRVRGPFPPGVYLVRLAQGGRSIASKAVLLR